MLALLHGSTARADARIDGQSGLHVSGNLYATQHLSGEDQLAASLQCGTGVLVSSSRKN